MPFPFPHEYKVELDQAEGSLATLKGESEPSLRGGPPPHFDGPGGVHVYVDSKSHALLDGTVLDFDEHNLMATNFTVRNPNAKSACGCGTSFGV